VPFTPSAAQENHWNPGAGTKQVSYLGDAALALGCPTAWDTTLGSQSVYICVVSDKGVDLTHPDLTKAPNHNLSSARQSLVSRPATCRSPTARSSGSRPASAFMPCGRQTSIRPTWRPRWD